MWSNNIGDAKIEGDQIEVFKILNGHENIDHKTFFKMKTGKRTRGHDITLEKGQKVLESILSPRLEDHKWVE